MLQLLSRLSNYESVNYQGNLFVASTIKFSSSTGFKIGNEHLKRETERFVYFYVSALPIGKL